MQHRREEGGGGSLCVPSTLFACVVRVVACKRACVSIKCMRAAPHPTCVCVHVDISQVLHDGALVLRNVPIVVVRDGEAVCDLEAAVKVEPQQNTRRALGRELFAVLDDF